MPTEAALSDEEASVDGLHRDVMAELNKIIDPCSVATALPAGMVDMGLVRSVRFLELSGGRCTPT